MRIDITNQIRTDPSFPIDPVRVYTGSALPIEIVGVPNLRGGKYVVGVKIALTNADGIPIEIPLARKMDGVYYGVFAASNFTTYGWIEFGATISLELASGNGGVHVEKVARGDFEVMSGSASARPGDPTTHYRTIGDDDYKKSDVVAGVQHYKKVGIVYDEEMGDWGFTLTGDYIIGDEGFVPVVK